jgi:hypothetical protein
VSVGGNALTTMDDKWQNQACPILDRSSGLRRAGAACFGGCSWCWRPVGRVSGAYPPACVLRRPPPLLAAALRALLVASTGVTSIASASIASGASIMRVACIFCGSFFSACLSGDLSALSRAALCRAGGCDSGAQAALSVLALYASAIGSSSSNRKKNDSEIGDQQATPQPLRRIALRRIAQRSPASLIPFAVRLLDARPALPLAWRPPPIDG